MTTLQQRNKAVEHVRHIMETEGHANAAAITRLLKERHNITVSAKTAWNYIQQVTEENRTWLTDMAKGAYIADLRKQYAGTKMAIRKTEERLESDTCKDMGRAALNNSLVVLKDQARDMVENQGLYLHMDDIVNNNGSKEENKETA